MNRQPIMVTQPQIDFNSYNAAAKEILMQILNGILSPATIGLEVAKDQNAMAQREKEKVTIFTRNGIISMEKEIQTSLMYQLLIADQLLHSEKDYNTIERPENEKDWGVTVVYDEFAGASFDAKLETILTGWQGGLVSDDMAIEYLHSDSPEEVRKRELDFIKERREEDKEIAGRTEDPKAVPSDEELAELGAVLGGDNEANDAVRGTNPLDVKERNDIPNITDYQEGKE